MSISADFQYSPICRWSNYVPVRGCCVCRVVVFVGWACWFALFFVIPVWQGLHGWVWNVPCSAVFFDVGVASNGVLMCRIGSCLDGLSVVLTGRCFLGGPPVRLLLLFGC